VLTACCAARRSPTSSSTSIVTVKSLMNSLWWLVQAPKVPKLQTREG
jgi:hypothetical protein